MEASDKMNVQTTRDFPVSVEALFKAWTDPEQLKQWWRPMGNQLTSVTNELQEGGNIEYRFQGQNSQNIVINGQYEQVVPNELLVYTWNWHVEEERLSDSRYKLTLNFRATEDGSQLQIRQESTQDSEAVQPTRGGWEGSLDSLMKFLSGGASHSENTKGAESSNASSTSTDGGNPGGAASTPMDHEGKPDYGSQGFTGG